MGSETTDFHLGAVLSVTTGKLLALFAQYSPPFRQRPTVVTMSSAAPETTAQNDATPTRVATVQELRLLAAWLPVWSNGVLVSNLADALDALREAWIGCGEEIGSRGLQSCGEWRCPDAPGRNELGKHLCNPCKEKLSAAISTLTGVTTHE